MAQKTGTTIALEAGYLAQDSATNAPAVNDTIRLALLNDVLLRYTGDVDAKTTLWAASDSGLTFAANAGIVETNTQDEFDSVLAAYESDTSAVPTILPPQLDHWTVEEMLSAYQNDYDGTMVGSGTKGWKAFAWERHASGDVNTGTTAIRVYVYPVLSATRYLALRVPKMVYLSALTETPDLTRREAGIVTRLLAWEIARLHSRDEAFLQQILAPIPSGILDRYFEGAKTHGWMQSGIRRTGALDA